MKKTLTRMTFRAFSRGLSVQLSMGENTHLVTFFHANVSSGENAYFVTDDPVLQAALMASPAYGKEFFLERQVNYVTEVPDIPKTIVEEVYTKEAVAAAPVAVPSDVTADEAEDLEEARALKPEEEVTNMAMAKAYMMNKFPDQKEDIVALKKADEVREYAKGKDVVFPNWL